jgi:type II secretory pathway pseudopilin PulG
MAALLVAMSILAVMMTVALPVWKQNAQREKEEELVFRGKQYVHAIALFQRKYVGAFPPNVNVLVEQRFLRKKYKDPITDDDFVPIPFGQQILPGTAQPGQTNQQGRGGQAQAPSAGGAGRSTNGPSSQVSTIAQAQSGRGASTFGTNTQIPGGGGLGIQGVSSKSKDESIRIYNGRTHYNEWQFVYQPPPQRGGATPGAVPGQTAPGQQQPGPPGQGPFGRGRGRGEGGNDGRGRGFGPGGRGFGPGGQQFPQPFPQPGQPGRGRG